MTRQQYMAMLVRDFHSAVAATIGADGHPQTRVIDMMLEDEQGIYFLTAKGKAFYEQLTSQQYIAITAVQGKRAISLQGKVKNIGTDRLDDILAQNPYMQQIYPEGSRTALTVFCLYEAQGEYFDITAPAHIIRETIVLGDASVKPSGYVIGQGCMGCQLCAGVCPQRCIDLSQTPAVIDQNRCLHCGNCAQICPQQAIEKRYSYESK